LHSHQLCHDAHAAPLQQNYADFVKIRDAVGLGLVGDGVVGCDKNDGPALL